jgi:hypothetical protein
VEKKVWDDPKLVELDIKNTEYGGSNVNNIDGPYIEVGNQKFWPSGS